MSRKNDEFRALLKDSGLNQARAAEFLGISTGAISQFVNDKCEPSEPVLRLFQRIVSDIHPERPTPLAQSLVTKYPNPKTNTASLNDRITSLESKLDRLATVLAPGLSSSQSSAVAKHAKETALELSDPDPKPSPSRATDSSTSDKPKPKLGTSPRQTRQQSPPKPAPASPE